MWSADELIVAAATVPGAGGRAIVRIAGHGLDAVLRRMFEASAAGFPAPGERPRAVSVRFAADGLRRDWGPLELTVLAWPGPAGPIGGPLAEVQLPSSAPLVDAVVAEACCHGARLARGGEFTLRAFLTGRLDLVQAEAVLGVVEAHTPDELTAALDRLAGGAGRSLAGVRSDLLDLLADIEASIDFADETAPDSVPVAVAWSEVLRRLDGCHAEIGEASRRLAMRTTAANDLPRLVLVGRPNIGKSSLLNRLAGHEAALVADESGTTRDWIEIRLPVAGAREVVLVDLAGVMSEAGEAAGEAAGPGIPTDAGDDEIGRCADRLPRRRGAGAPADSAGGRPPHRRAHEVGSRRRAAVRGRDRHEQPHRGGDCGAAPRHRGRGGDATAAGPDRDGADGGGLRRGGQGGRRGQAGGARGNLRSCRRRGAGGGGHPRGGGVARGDHGGRDRRRPARSDILPALHREMRPP